MPVACKKHYKDVGVTRGCRPVLAVQVHSGGGGVEVLACGRHLSHRSKAIIATRTSSEQIPHARELRETGPHF